MVTKYELLHKTSDENLVEIYETILNSSVLHFLSEMVAEFQGEINVIKTSRAKTSELLKLGAHPLDFLPETKEIRDSSWTVDSLPKPLLDRRIDVGDVDPTCNKRLLEAFESKSQGVQVDFDDGFCPTWKNVLLGHYNIYHLLRGNLREHGVDKTQNNLASFGKTYMMFRPRAWNMIERNLLVNGNQVPGPLFDFAIHMYLNGKLLSDSGMGPFLYLSKVEGWKEANIWNKIFNWTEEKLHLPKGCIKACVLIETITAVFEMDEILWSLRSHSAGLNCGLWDYAASFITRCGHDKNKIFPDRSKYVDMSRQFLDHYRLLLISTCHKRKAPATGGMFAHVTSTDVFSSIITKNKAEESKRIEALAGADGAMVYDINLVIDVQRTFTEKFPKGCTNQINSAQVYSECNQVNRSTLLQIPSGEASFAGMKINVEVALIFIFSWLQGVGHFILKNQVEDSATAEISRSQLWQQIKHKVFFEDYDQHGFEMANTLRHGASIDLVRQLCEEIIQSRTENDKILLRHASTILLNLVSETVCPTFITTYLGEKGILSPKL